jgi:hypothetical protein
MTLMEAAKSQGLNTPTTNLSKDLGFLSGGFDITFFSYLGSSYGCLVSKCDMYVHSFPIFFPTKQWTIKFTYRRQIVNYFSGQICP